MPGEAVWLCPAAGLILGWQVVCPAGHDQLPYDRRLLRVGLDDRG